MVRSERRVAELLAPVACGARILPTSIGFGHIRNSAQACGRRSSDLFGNRGEGCEFPNKRGYAADRAFSRRTETARVMAMRSAMTRRRPSWMAAQSLRCS